MNQIVGALWKKTDKNGKHYFSGIIRDLHGEVNLAAFPNDRKESINHPDFNIVISFGYEKNGKKQSEKTVEEPDEVNEDLPF